MSEPLASNDESVSRAVKIFSLIGSLMLVVGPFFPWATTWVSGLAYSQSVTDGLPDVVFILCAGLLTAFLGVVRLATKVHDAVLWVQLVVSALIAWTVILDMDSAGVGGYTVQFGPGMWASLVGAIIVISGSLSVVTSFFTKEGRDLHEHRRLATMERRDKARVVKERADAARAADLQRLRSKYRT